MTFVDTSAFICVLDERQQEHSEAVEIWTRLIDQREQLVTTNYVCLETWAVLQSRLGLPAVRKFNDQILSVFEVREVTRAQLQASKDKVLAGKSRTFSLVDSTSLNVMKDEGIDTVFVFDRHFENQGFTVL